MPGRQPRTFRKLRSLSGGRLRLSTRPKCCSSAHVTVCSGRLLDSLDTANTSKAFQSSSCTCAT